MHIKENHPQKIINKNNGPLGATFFIAYIGAAVYFVNQVDGFWSIIWAVIKAGAWPGILIYHALKAFGV